MKLIRLTRGLSAKVDDSDFESLSRHKWCADHKGYAIRRKGSAQVYMHKEILSAPESFQVDHINQDKRDNRRSNLRIASKAENNRNRPIQANNKSGFKGVGLSRRGKWEAHIKVSGKQIHLGTFNTPRQAADAYNRAALENYGEFSRLNDTTEAGIG